METTDKIASHLHPEGSFDVAAHPVPTGREEVWRFTPLKRLRDLHKEAPLSPLGASATSVEVEAAEGVEVRRTGADDPARGSSGYVPSDRVSARAWAAGRLRFGARREGAWTRPPSIAASARVTDFAGLPK